MGRWYEIARYDHKFERVMTNVTATYALPDNGKIEVLNEGMKDDKHKTANGINIQFAGFDTTTL